MKKIKITTNRINIRNLELKDLPDFYVYRSNPAVTKHQGFDVMNMEQAKSFIEKNLPKRFGKAGEWVQYAIENKATGKLIGDCAIKLQQNDTRIAEIGITISHFEQKKGYAKEAFFGIFNLFVR